MNDIVLQVDNLKKYFPIRGKKKQMVHAVDGVSFHIRRGKTLGLVGESGCGKSSCARTIIRIHKPDSGKIRVNGSEISKLNQKELLPHRKQMQMIFQDPYSSLNARMTVRDILAEPLIAHKITTNKSEQDDLIYEMLNKVGLSSEHAGRYPHEFSGGQRQRVGIARAFILKPKLIICDEPISALDVSIQAQIVNMLSDFQKELHLSYLFIAHDLSMVRYISDDVGVMYLGKLVELCNTDEIYKNPLHPYTRGLLSSIPIPDPAMRTLESEGGIQGDLPSPIHLPEGCRFHNRCPKAMDICQQKEPELVEYLPEHKVACHLFSSRG